MKKDFNRIGATLCSSMRPRSSTTSWLNKFKLLALVLTTMLSVNLWGAASVIAMNGNQQEASTTISSTNVESGSAGNVSWTATSASYNSSKSRWDWASGSSVTFSVPSGYLITKIEGTTTSTKGTWSVSPSATIEGNGSSPCTISGLSASSVTITTSGVHYIKDGSITVTYSAGSSYTISATVNNGSYGEVSVSGNTITVTPNTGYCVNTSNPYTVTSGTADVTYNNDNTFTVETEADCSVQVNLKAQELFTVTFFNDKTQLKQVQVYEGDAIGKSNLPSTPTAWHATSTEFAGWTTQFIKGNTQTTINDNQFVDSYTKVTGNMTVYALWASTDATTSTFDASNTSNLTESDDYFEFSENTTGVILGGYDIFTDKGSYFRAAEGDNGDVAIYVQSPNKVIKQVVFTIDGTASSYGIASVTDGSLSSTSSSPQTASNVRTNYMEAYPNGSTIDLKKVVVTTYTNYITNSITYTDLFLELKIAHFYRIFMSFF